MKKTKLITLLLVVALAVTSVVGGTLAYLQDSEANVNVMTLGKVDIEQHEYQRVGEDGNYETKEIDGKTSYVLEQFEQAKPLLPIVGDPNEPSDSPAYAGFDSIPVRMSQVDSYGGMEVFAGKNAQDKFVVVENTGKTDAYIRTIVALEVGSADASLIGTSYHSTWTKNVIGTVEIDGNNYYVIEYVYAGGQLSDGSWRHENGILPAGDTAYPSLAQVYLKHNATNEDCEKLDGNGNGVYEILVVSQAVQADGFADAKTALNTAFGETTIDNNPWCNTLIVDVNDQDMMKNGLTEGMDVIVTTDIVEVDSSAFNGNGASITLAGVAPLPNTPNEEQAYAYLAFAPGKGKDTTVENLTVTGSGFVEVGHHGEGGGKYVINKLNVIDVSATLYVTEGGNKISAAFGHYGNATMTDCVMTGTKCAKEGYTAYDAAFTNGTKTVINGGEYGKIYLSAQAHVTINDAEVDEIDSCAITTKNLGKLTIGARAKVGTINLTPTGTYSPALVIEDGATVGKIVYNGTEYTQAEWMLANIH